MRVLLAPFGGAEALVATLAAVQSDIAELLRVSAAIRGEYLEGRAPFQRYAPTRAMIHDFLTNFGILVNAWAERSMDSARQWAAMSVDEQQALALAAFDRNSIPTSSSAVARLSAIAPGPSKRVRGHRQSAATAGSETAQTHRDRLGASAAVGLR